MSGLPAPRRSSGSQRSSRLLILPATTVASDLQAWAGLSLRTCSAMKGGGGGLAFYDYQYTRLGIGSCDLAKLLAYSKPRSMLLGNTTGTT